MGFQYPGLVPSNVNQDAKYSVVSGPDGSMHVRLIYRVSAGEKWLLTTGAHKRLVEMVNQVKAQVNGSPGGAFYINEYSDVLVPDNQGGCVHAGFYETMLTFDFNGQEIGPEPPSTLGPGDQWSGPHVGIRYVLAAGGDDLKYDNTLGARVLTVRLSDHVGKAPAVGLARRLAAVKGNSGGRIFINERCHFFAPVEDKHGGWNYLYLGSIDDDPWFPAPDVPGRP